MWRSLSRDFASWDGSKAKIFAWTFAGTPAMPGSHTYAAQLIGLMPDVILVASTTNLTAIRQATSTVPIVFVAVTDLVGAGFVASLALPGGNATGFTTCEYGISAKWLELLKAIAPGVTRAVTLRDPANRAGIGQVRSRFTAATIGACRRVQSPARPLQRHFPPAHVGRSCRECRQPYDGS
jgi:ABC transporter substrate binding protein